MQMTLLQKAVVIAMQAHEGQRDKSGNIYIDHPLRVMMAVDSEEEKIVAILHDVVEDNQDWSFDRLKAEGFPTDIVDAIASVTRSDGEDYAAFVRRARGNPIGKVVKLADANDNLNATRMSHLTPENRMRLEAKYKSAVDILKS